MRISSVRLTTRRLLSVFVFMLVLGFPVGLVHAQLQGGATAQPAGQTPVASPTVDGATPAADASADTNASGGTLSNPLKYKSLEDLFKAILDALIKLGSIILTGALVLTGFRFVTAAGNEEKIRSAKNTLLWTIIGGLLLLGATAIEAVISATVASITV